MPKDHFHFLNFANFAPPPYVALEKPGHETPSEMLYLLLLFQNLGINVLKLLVFLKYSISKLSIFDQTWKINQY